MLKLRKRITDCIISIARKSLNYPSRNGYYQPDTTKLKTAVLEQQNNKRKRSN